MMKKTMLYLLLLWSVLRLAACQKQPQPEIKLGAAGSGQPGAAGVGRADPDPWSHRL